MKALALKLILLFETLYISYSYDLNNGNLISELSSSSNQCIKKLSPVLSILPTDEQKLLASSISNTTERCFDPIPYKNSTTSNLKNMNIEYALRIGNKTNSFVKSFECYINSARDRLDDKYVEYIKNELTSLTPYGIYPAYTRCLSVFVKNTNFVLATRRRLLLTYLLNASPFQILNIDGTIKGFAWKSREREIIVNEFMRYQRCVSDLTLGVNRLMERMKMFFANSKECGITPGAFDKELGLYFYDDRAVPKDNSTNTDVKITAGVAPSSAPTTTTATVVRTPNSSSEVSTSASIAISPPSEGSTWVNPNPSNDPCFDWEKYYANLKPTTEATIQLVQPVAPSIAVSAPVAPTTSGASTDAKIATSKHDYNALPILSRKEILLKSYWKGYKTS
jgi:hypothetical protein